MTTMTDDTWLALRDAPAIDGLRFRRPRGDDADYGAMAGVIAAANRRDEIPWLPTARHVREELEGSPGVEPTADVVVAEIDGRMVATAEVSRVMRDGIAVYSLDGHVHPDHRRRGIGRALLRENIRRAEERAATEPDGQASEIRSFVEESQLGHRALMAQHGFVEIRWFFLMRRFDLHDVPEAPLPDGLEFRPVQEDQLRAIVAAETEAFRDHWSSRDMTEEDFQLMLGREELDTSLWVVAWDGDEIAGVVQNWIWRDENEQLGIARGWLEHISVRRPWRRMGVGRAITAASLRRLAEAGMTDAMLGVDAGNPTGALSLYEGLGFEVHQRSSAYRLAR